VRAGYDLGCFVSDMVRDNPTMPSSSGMASVLGRHRVLVVDDHRPLLLMLERNFRARGIDVCIAHADEAIQLLVTERFVAVLLDVNMPGVNGLDLLSVLRARDPDVPVVMMTAETQIQVASESLNRGADAFVQKPASPSHLIDVVERVVRQRQSGSTDGDTQNTLVKIAIDQLYLRCNPVHDLRNRVAAYLIDPMSRDSMFKSPAELAHHAENTGNGRLLGRTSRDLLVRQCGRSLSRVDLIVSTSLAQLAEVGEQSLLAMLDHMADRVVLSFDCSEPLAVELPQVERRLAIRNRGYRLGLSGVGAGHGAIAALASVTPEVVTMESSLLGDVHRHAPSQHLVAMLSQFCRGISASLIAEGVISAQQQSCLTSLGIQHFQGDHIAAGYDEIPRL
jgi:CheY-like chemotaxis protein